MTYPIAIATHTSGCTVADIVMATPSAVLIAAHLASNLLAIRNLHCACESLLAVCVMLARPYWSISAVSMSLNCRSLEFWPCHRIPFV